jgi:hypothetical protein
LKGEIAKHIADNNELIQKNDTLVEKNPSKQEQLFKLNRSQSTVRKEIELDIVLAESKLKSAQINTSHELQSVIDKANSDTIKHKM